jgi:hypothetical protein
MHQPLTRATWRRAHRTVRALSRGPGFDSNTSYAAQAHQSACMADARNNVLLSLPPKARALLDSQPVQSPWTTARNRLLQLLADRRAAALCGFRDRAVADYMRRLRGAA